MKLCKDCSYYTKDVSCHSPMILDLPNPVDGSIDNSARDAYWMRDQPKRRGQTVCGPDAIWFEANQPTEPEIARCVCGSPGEIFKTPNGHFIHCHRTGCWSGPTVPELNTAIVLWNRIVSLSHNAAAQKEG